MLTFRESTCNAHTEEGKPVQVSLWFSDGLTTMALLVAAQPSHAGDDSGKFKHVLLIMQVAPTILKALGLDPNALEAVRIEGTQVLPGLDFCTTLGWFSAVG